MPFRNVMPSRQVRARPFCNARRRDPVIRKVNSVARSWKFMEAWRATTPCMPAAIRPKFLASFYITGCWCTNKEQCPGCPVTPMSVRESIINLHAMELTMLDDSGLRETLHRTKGASRFRGSSKAHSRDGAVIIPAKMMRYIVRRNNSAALPRFSSIVNGHFYALDTYFDHYQRNARGYITGLITRWGVPVPFQPRWFLGCFNTSLTIDGGHMYR